MSFIKRFSFFALPPIFQGILSLLILPLTTNILGPREYGIFAFASSITGFGTIIASMGASYVTAAHYQTSDISERKHIVMSILFIGFLLSIVFSVIVLLLWPFFASHWEIFREISRRMLFISLCSMVLGIPWIFSADVLTLEGKASLFAWVQIVQSIVLFLATIGALYVFHLGIFSLFIGQLIAAFVATLGSIKTVLNYKGGKVVFKWIKEILKTGVSTIAPNIGESVYLILERSLLILWAGLSQLGLYTHSQQYRTATFMGLNALARTIFPLSLSEAREAESRFEKTRQAWNVGYLGVTVLGIFFATFGRDVISLLTHGKFSEAYVFVVLWMVLILVQSAGKPHTAFLLASNLGKLYARMHVYALLLAGLSLFLFIPWFGVFGALASLFVQMIFFRILIQIQVRKFRRISSQDRWIIIGSVFILLAFGLSQLAKFDRIGNLALLIIMYAALGYFGRHILRNLFARIRQSL